MWGFGSRVVLGLAVFSIGVCGVLTATEGSTFPAGLATVSLAPAAQTMPAQTTCPAAGGYLAPVPGSTGVPTGLALCAEGPITITRPGAVLDGWDIRGGIVVDAPGVVIRRSRITGDGVTPFGVWTTPAGSVRVEDTTLTGDFPEAAIGDERWTAERIEITRVTHDGARLGQGARLRNSTLHDFAPAAGAAGDALVVHGADVCVEGNRIEPGPVDGSAVRVVTATVPGDSPVLIRGNVLGGGGYTVHEAPAADAASRGRPVEVRITGNRFRPGAARGPLRVSSAAVLSDNTFVDGRPLPRHERDTPDTPG